MSNLAAIGGILAGLAALLSVAFKSRRTVDAGCKGIVFVLGKPRRTKWFVPASTDTTLEEEIAGQPGITWDGTEKFFLLPKLYSPGFVWVIPLFMRLETVKVSECNTTDETVATERPDGNVTLVKAILTYDMTDVAVVKALCVVPEFAKQVSWFFADLLGDVFAETDSGEPREKLRRKVLEAAAKNENLICYGVAVKRVSLVDLSPNWVGQLGLPGLVRMFQDNEDGGGRHAK